jgi:hypothetical protein
LLGSRLDPQFEVRDRGGGHQSATPEPLGGNGGEAASPVAAGEPEQAGVGGAEPGVARDCSRGEALLFGHVTNLRDLGGIQC